MEDQSENIIGAAIKSISYAAFVFALTESPSQPVEEAGRTHGHHLHARASAQQDNCDTGWILVCSSSAKAACPPTHAKEVPIIRGLERVLIGSGMNPKVEFLGTKQVDDQVGCRDSLVPDCASLTMQCHKVEEESTRVRQCLLAVSEDDELWSRQASCCAP